MNPQFSFTNHWHSSKNFRHEKSRRNFLLTFISTFFHKILVWLQFIIHIYALPSCLFLLYVHFYVRNKNCMKRKELHRCTSKRINFFATKSFLVSFCLFFHFNLMRKSIFFFIYAGFLMLVCVWQHAISSIYVCMPLETMKVMGEICWGWSGVCTLVTRMNF